MQIRKFSGYYLVAIVAFCIGIVCAAYGVWPYSAFKDAQEIFATDPHTGQTFRTRLDAALDTRPARALVKYEIKDSAGFTALRPEKFSERRGDLLIRTSGQPLPGYLFLFGAFDFDGALYGALLIDPQGRLVHTWKITEADIAGAVAADIEKFPHGVEVLADGSLIFAFDGGEALQRIDACSKRQWARMGQFHHAVTRQDDAVWTLQDAELANTFKRPAFLKIGITDGKVVTQFNLADLRKANPDLSIFNIRQADFYDGPKLLLDPFHPNDVDPLPAHLASAFPQFEPGDLLISLRSLNLIIVIDPQTLKVKWWRIGNWHRQHDPDWLPDGRISVLDNAMHSPPSRIIAIDPKTNQTSVLLDGAKMNFYTWIRGKHQQFANGGMLITSAQQGRAFAVDASGRTILEVLNVYNGQTGENLVISEARFLNNTELNLGGWPKCE